MTPEEIETLTLEMSLTIIQKLGDDCSGKNMTLVAGVLAGRLVHAAATVDAGSGGVEAVKSFAAGLSDMVGRMTADISRKLITSPKEELN